MSAYAHKLTATGKYVAVVEWDGAATYPVPAGHTRELVTGANLAQVLADMAEIANATAAARVVDDRERAQTELLSDPSPDRKIDRTLALLVLERVNAIHDWLMDLKAEVAATSTLADYKNRVANNLPALPQFTQQQLLNAMIAKLLDGSAD